MARGTLGSFEKFNYLLRPSKQVERKLFIEALHRISDLDYRVQDYAYVGLGSVFYADFLLFHKYLYIDDMTCAEKENIPKRMAFNKPFSFIDLHMSEIATLIPKLDRTKEYIVWLDYDAQLNADILHDVSSLAGMLAAGSFLIVTVDAEPRLPDDIDAENQTVREREERLLERYQEAVGHLFPRAIEPGDLSYRRLPTLLATVLKEAVEEEVGLRGDVGFQLMFNFRYADNAQMLTVGGLIDTPDQLQRLRDSTVFDLRFVHDDLEPLSISVPPLTMREKHWLENNFDQIAGPSDLAFELDGEMLDSFRRYYRHYPVYQESLI